jgi:rhamnose transport system permease protein
MIELFKTSGIKNFIRNNNREFTLALIIIVISVLVQIQTQGKYLSSQNIYDLLREVAILAMLAVGMTMVIISGGIDLSIGSTMGLAGMVSAMFLRDHRDISLVIIVLMAVAIGCACGIVNGLLVAKLRIFPIIATLGTMDIYRGLAYLRSGGQWVGQGLMTEQFLSIATGNFLGVNYLVWIAIVTYIFGFIFLNRMRIGRYIYAVGNSEESASVTGINVDKIKIIAYTINGVIAGLAGLLYICKFGNAQAESATGYEMNVIAACVLGGVSITGGVGSITGVLLGSLLFGVLNNIVPLIQVSQFWQQAIRGLIILLSIIFNALTERNKERKAIQWKTWKTCKE